MSDKPNITLDIEAPSDCRVHAEIESDAAPTAAPAEESSAKAQLGEVSMLRAALEGLLSAAENMPRRTPAPGGASTEHPFQIMAAHVWANDRACEEAAKTLAFLAAPAEARSVGAPAGYYPLHPKGMACKWIRSWTDGQGQYWCCNQGQDLPTPPKAEGK